ncbi:MerR family transcriptional regulator [Metabacillus sp. GX 13764]|uniref:MerR family transcriptional regulator n=1 Tax=Metabacillus kandeliae TaxID=2900151 RepID=UPI001E35D988|nr:MerR family transcriptional regulator [Metabacillus kandeliae]
MIYTINQVAEIWDISAHTLRFYDKEGLLPFISRTSNGNRQFSERDLELVKLICCLKDTGMSIKEIRRYMEISMAGEKTFETRKEMMKAHRKEVLRQINDLKKNLRIIDLKVAYYNSDQNRKDSL